MKVVTLQEYFMGRDVLYPPSSELLMNAKLTVLRTNLLLHAFGEYRHVTSGYRPKEINQGVVGAAKNSHHIHCRAVDLSDPDQSLNKFCIKNQKILEDCGLYMEMPVGPNHAHCHLQIIPPKSGKRIFIA